MRPGVAFVVAFVAWCAAQALAGEPALVDTLPPAQFVVLAPVTPASSPSGPTTTAAPPAHAPRAGGAATSKVTP